MEWTAEQLNVLRQGTDAGNQGDAPRAVLEAVGSLLGLDVEPLAVVCGGSDEENPTVWRVAVLTASTLIYVEGRRRGGVWALGYDDKPADSLIAWAKPIRSVASVAVESTTSRDDPFAQRQWRWSTTYTIDVGGDTIQLPLSGFRAADVADRVDLFVRELMRRL
jgi:hypothetical protein